MSIEAIVFDIGETLLDDTREYGAWADWLGVPRHTFSAVLGAVTSRGDSVVEAFRYFRSDFDITAERSRREAVGVAEYYTVEDLYEDVRPTLAELKSRGIWLGAAGNQTARAGTLLRDLGLPLDALVTSGELGVSKPDPQFFQIVAGLTPCQLNHILYVGDHRDNDIIPAKKAGMQTAFIQRGPWGYLWAEDPKLAEAMDWSLQSLAEIPALI